MGDKHHVSIAAILISFLTIAANGSNLSVVVEKRAVRALPQGTKMLQVTWADTRVTAALSLDVYSSPNIPSSAAGFAEVKRLSQETWLDAVKWEVRTTGEPFEVIRPGDIIQSNARRRGPSAQSEINRDAAVDMVSYHAIVALGMLAPGDYQLRLQVGGVLSGPDIFSVRTGDERSSLRGAYPSQKG